MLRFAAVLTGGRASAEDVVQEVPIRAHQHCDKIGVLDRPELYVRKLAVNEFVPPQAVAAGALRAAQRPR